MGFKLYNGCPNDELQAHWDSQDRAKEFIRSNGLLITWFPVECKYALCEKDTYKNVGDWFGTPEQAARWVKEEYLADGKDPGAGDFILTDMR